MGPRKSRAAWTWPGVPPVGHWHETGLWFVATAALYVWLGQTALYNRDAHVLLLAAQSDTVHQHHLLYFPLLRATHALIGWLELGIHREATWCSALLTAAGIAFVHRAALRVLDRGSARVATGLVATCPAVAFFATVAEVHGPFLCFAGIAAWAATRFATRPSLATATGAGLATGATYAAHATGALIPAALMPLVCAAWWSTDQPSHRRSLVIGVGVWLLLHSVLVLACHPVASTLGLLDQHTSSVALLLSNGLPPLGDLPQSIVHESLLPFAPLWLGVPWVIAFAKRLEDSRSEVSRLHAGARAGAWMLALAWIVYQSTAYALLQPFVGSGEYEHGAYLLPLAWPAAWLAATSIRSPLGRTLLIGTSLIVAILRIQTADDPERTRPWADSVRELVLEDTQETRPLLLLGDYDELEALLVHLTELDPVEDAFWFTRDAELWLAHPDAIAGLRPILDQRPVWVTAGTEAFFTDPRMLAKDPRLRSVWRALTSTFQLEPLEHGAFDGYRLLPHSAPR